MKNYIYFIKCKDLYKIGKANNYNRRFSSISTSNPFAELKLVILVSDNNLVEKSLHKLFEQSKYKGEWFNISDDIIADIENILNDKYCYEIVKDNRDKKTKEYNEEEIEIIDLYKKVTEENKRHFKEIKKMFANVLADLIFRKQIIGEKNIDKIMEYVSQQITDNNTI